MYVYDCKHFSSATWLVYSIQGKDTSSASHLFCSNILHVKRQLLFLDFNIQVSTLQLFTALWKAHDTCRFKFFPEGIQFHQCCSRKLVATLRSLLEALKASKASTRENPISMSRATYGEIRERGRKIKIHTKQPTQQHALKN